jgi:hypothetical protein
MRNFTYTENSSSRANLRIPCIDIFYLILNKCMPVRVSERSEAYIVFARSEAGIVVYNPTQDMDVWCLCLCARAFFCVCVQIEALRRADHPPKESYQIPKI